MLKSKLVLCSLLIALGPGVLAAQADMVTVASVGTVNMNANTQSGYVNINVFDANPGTAVNLYGWSLGLRVVPLSGATGTVTIDGASMVYAPNPLLTNPNPTPNPAPTVDQPAVGDYTVFASDNAFNSVTVPGTQRGLVSVKFNASLDASGNFGLQLVDSGGLAQTYWTNFDTFGNEPLYFGASPIIGTGGAQIGILNVQGAAVPEPSSLLLAAGIAGCAVWRKRRKAVAAASV